MISFQQIISWGERDIRRNRVVDGGHFFTDNGNFMGRGRLDIWFGGGLRVMSGSSARKFILFLP